MQIYVNKDGQQYGPYTIEQLHEYVQQGYFTAADHACHDGQNWVTVGQVPGFAGGAQAQPQQPQRAQQPQQQAHAAQQAQAQATAAAAAHSATNKKYILIFGGIAAGVILLFGVLAYVLWPEDEEPSREPIAGAGKSGDETASSTSRPATPGSPSNPSSSVALIDRMPSNALGAITIDVEKVLAKGGEQAAAMIPSEAPPMALSDRVSRVGAMLLASIIEAEVMEIEEAHDATLSLVEVIELEPAEVALLVSEAEEEEVEEAEEVEPVEAEIVEAELIEEDDEVDDDEDEEEIDAFLEDFDE